jgi:hypothetical protein
LRARRGNSTLGGRFNLNSYGLGIYDLPEVLNSSERPMLKWRTWWLVVIVMLPRLSMTKRPHQLPRSLVSDEPPSFRARDVDTTRIGSKTIFAEGKGLFCDSVRTKSMCYLRQGETGSNAISDSRCCFRVCKCFYVGKPNERRRT